MFKSKIVWIFGLENHSRGMNFTADRIEKLFKNGQNFAFLYLKECSRLIIKFLAGTPETVGPGKGIIVCRDFRGLPMILDSDTRQLFVEGKSHRKLVVAYLTLISVFRVFPTKVVPKLDTIVSEFSGAVKTFDSSVLRAALRDLTDIRGLNLQQQRLIKLETASPNGRKSAWGASLDTLAFFFYPLNFLSFARYQIWFGSPVFLLGAVALLILIWPVVLIYKIIGIMPTIEMGKLGVVYDQAGKARIVGITNYWIQLALKPLHDTIFRLLKSIKEDGTFDQTRKLEELRKLGKKFHCFDLSAATDRLPIDIQRDILNILRPGLGTSGVSILDISGKFKKQYVKYAVGQPMGAYSSGAMLALTHHVIVKVAAIRVGVKRFQNYSVLGDDIIICDDAVADSYLSLMEMLGVSINPSKSVVSYDIAEFAKRWVGPDYDMSPIGPGLLLRLIRYPYYIGAVLNEAVRLDIIDNFPQLLMMTKKYPKDISLALGSTVGLGGIFAKKYGDIHNIIPYAFSSVRDPEQFRYCLFEALTQLQLDKGRDSKAKLLKDMDFFYLNWGKIFSSKSGSLRFIEFVLKPVGPGFWCYGLSYERAKNDIETFPKSGDGSGHCIEFLARSNEEINTSSIDGTQKIKIKSGKEGVRKLNDYFERAVIESESYFSS